MRPFTLALRTGMPGIVSYSAGTFSGARVHASLRAVLATLGSVSIPATFMISKVGSSFDDDGAALDDSYNTRIEKFLDEYEWYANALRIAHDKIE